MDNREINDIVETAVTNISKIAEVNTIVGKPLVTMDGTTILPVSQVTFAFMAGGGEYGDKTAPKGVLKDGFMSKFAGGSGGGATLTPVGFLVVNKDGVKLIDTESQSSVEKLADVARDILKNFKD